MNEPIDPGFAPNEPTDEREPGDWSSRYTDPVARRGITLEAVYLAVHLAGVIITVFVLAVCADRETASALAHSKQESDVEFQSSNAPNLTATERAQLQQPLHWPQLLHAWLGGLLGGTVFATKWLYHGVAKNIWNIDRRLWRLFIPHLSGALALAFVGLMGSGLIVIFDQKALASVWVCFGLSFLVGCFSDSASAKLAEVARTLFGTTKGAEGSKRSSR
jgi:hypothetical protein